MAIFVNGSGRNEQSLQRTFHRCFLPIFGSIGQVVSEEKIFKNRPIRNKNCLCRPCLLMDRDKMSNLYRGPSIDASYQVSVHLAEGVSEEKMWNVNGRRTPSDGKSSHCFWQGELKMDDGWHLFEKKYIIEEYVRDLSCRVDLYRGMFIYIFVVLYLILIFKSFFCFFLFQTKRWILVLIKIEILNTELPSSFSLLIHSVYVENIRNSNAPKIW